MSRNEVVASAGGPLILPRLYQEKNRTFWFFVYEGNRTVAPYTQTYPVPTEAMRKGDFRGLLDSQGRQYKIYDPLTTDPNTWERQQCSYQGQLNVLPDQQQNEGNHSWATGERLPTGEYSGVARRPHDKQVYGTVEEYRMTGWSNYNGVQLELERRYARGYGFQIHCVMGNLLGAGGQEWSGTSIIPDLHQFLPGKVPADLDARNRCLNYQLDTSVPKHRVRWNWIMDLPFGKGRWLGRDAHGFVNRLIGGWQIAGVGSLRTNYFSLPTDIYPTGEKIEIYGYKYPIQDCLSGACLPGYLLGNGYLPVSTLSRAVTFNCPLALRGRGRT